MLDTRPPKKHFTIEAITCVQLNGTAAAFSFRGVIEKKKKSATHSRSVPRIVA